VMINNNKLIQQSWLKRHFLQDNSSRKVISEKPSGEFWQPEPN